MSSLIPRYDHEANRTPTGGGGKSGEKNAKEKGFTGINRKLKTSATNTGTEHQCGVSRMSALQKHS
jgi:hypothetical protein